MFGARLRFCRVQRPFLLTLLLPSLACATGRGPQEHPSGESNALPVRGTAGSSTACALPPPASPELERRTARNVEGHELETCSTSPMTGAYRDGRCTTGPDDVGVHVVCARITAEFLTYTRDRGNDLVTARGGFPGLRPGDKWCLCAARWAEAEAGGVAPPVDLAATEAEALRFVSRATLAQHAIP